MADLEDSILKRNIPGRYASWVDENDDRRRDDGDDAGNDNGDAGSDVSDSEDDEYYFRGLPDAAQPTQPQMQQRPSGNTGVKGVLADYREAQEEERLRREEERLENLRMLQRATRPAVRSENDRNDNQNGNSSKTDDGGDGDLDDSDDDEFLKRLRNQRLAQLKQSAASSSTPSLPAFGSLESVSPEEYVRLVDETDPRAYLVVHLTDPAMLQCRMLHSALDKVAQCMENTKFVEVNALEANPNLDPICLPAVLVYKGGKLAHNLVRFADELPREFGAKEVREALEGLLGAAEATGSTGDA